MNILSQIQYASKKDIINSLSYYDHITEYPIANIVDFDWKNILKQPNENFSRDTYTELLEVYNKAKTRSKEATDLIRKIDYNANFLVYNLLDKLNIKFEKDKFQELYSIIQPLLTNIKNFYNRARPYQLASFYDIEIDVLVTSTHHTPSYPSGHVLYTRLASNIIIEQFPNLKNELDRITNITSNCRIAQGVHYASDNQASIVLTDYLYKKLKELLYG